MQGLRISFEPYAGEAEQRQVRDSLDLYNVATTGHAAFYPVTFFLRDARDEILGGLLGQIWGQWLEVKTLFVAEPARRAGHASRLLAAAEAYGRERGCIGATLSTYSFQARGFYEKQGYTVFGTLEDEPPGHAHHFLSKRFAG